MHLHADSVSQLSIQNPVYDSNNGPSRHLVLFCDILSATAAAGDALWHGLDSCDACVGCMSIHGFMADNVPM